jgi:uncharacterized protein (TIGR02270 family)
VLVRHAEELAFLWTTRARAVGEPHYSLQDLARLDERVEAHLDGLLVAGPSGWSLCKARLANAGPGVVFALTVLAFGVGDRKWMRDAVQAGCASPDLWPGLASGIAWIEYAKVAEWIEVLLKAGSPEYRALGIAVSAMHRADAGATLATALRDASPQVRARALRAVGETGRVDLLDLAGHRLDDADPSCKFWAAWTLVRLGRRDALRRLATFADHRSPFSGRALQLVLRAMDVASGRRLVRGFAASASGMRAAVSGAGFLGDPASITWLIAKMESPKLAKLAGEAFTMITGVDLAEADLDQDAPQEAPAATDPLEKALELDEDSSLSFPSAQRVAGWWAQNRDAFTDGVRYLGGLPISGDSATEVLMTGKQRLRSAAALELALLDPTKGLFDVRARGRVQESILAGVAREGRRCN